jgi:two-component system KDP operon response regulator KdpE
MKILIIEDDRGIIETISLAFNIRWPEAKIISTHLGEHGVDLVESERPDIVILDLGLPDINGFEVLKRIRLFSDIPVLILTVRSDEPEVVKGLEWGADDYVIKPFRQMELLSRVKTLVRRRGSLEEERPLVHGNLRFYPATRELFYGEKRISLTHTEGLIFYQLIKRAGKVVSRTILAESVWDTDSRYVVDSTKVHIRRLRKKLEVDPSNPKVILTRTGIGYFLAQTE